MIELITGTPGSGKTLWALSTVKARAEKEGRPVFYSGVPDLALGWTEITPQKWFDCPANSIVVIDECQRVFRPRSWSGAVPDYVSELETHRHKGIDLVFITQHPMLIDANIRRLVGRHFHVSRRFGLPRSSVFEFESCKDQPLAKMESATARHEWSFPKEAFNWYKSAEVHTHKARLPAKIWVLGGMVLLIAAVVWYGVSRWSAKMQAKPDVVVLADKVLSSGSVGVAASGDGLDWFRGQVPRVVGLPHTAPVFDDAQKNVLPAYPVACASAGARCTCYSQQATRIDMPDGLCREIVAHGFFVPMLERESRNDSNVRVASVNPSPMGGDIDHAPVVSQIDSIPIHSPLSGAVRPSKNGLETRSASGNSLGRPAAGGAS